MSTPLLLSLPAFADDAVSSLRELERLNGGRLGVALLDTAGGRRVAYRGDERFPMCSTFKFLAAAMTLGDNTAGTLMLASFGGPAGLTAFARTPGNTVTRLDRIETELNEDTPGDPRDTTSPLAMLGTMQRLVAGDVLSAASRERLIGWLVANKTGDKRLRAGMPASWRIGDKTGTGGNGSANDIAVAWPPGRVPVFVTTYYTRSTISDAARSAVIAEVGRIATAALPDQGLIRPPASARSGAWAGTP